MAFHNLIIHIIERTYILILHFMLVREWLLSAGGYQRILIIPCNYVKVPLILSTAHTQTEEIVKSWHDDGGGRNWGRWVKAFHPKRLNGLPVAARGARTPPIFVSDFISSSS